MNVYEFDYELLDHLPVVAKEKKVKQEGKKNRKKVRELYINELLAFDIETTNDNDLEQSWMYIWQLQIGDDITIFGRTWEEFKFFIHEAVDHIGDKHLVIYIHNEAFEYGFLSGIYNFDNSEVFATKNHKVIRCTMYGHIEFRCSYFLTNLGLDAFTKQMAVENKKLSGARYDYDKIRYPWTEMSEEEIAYCLNDVKGLVQALRKKMESDGDDITTIPLTSTGYVRRDLKKAMESYPQIRIAEMYPDKDLYVLLREAFRGGNTTANRYVTSWEVYSPVENVSSFDMTSSYPNVLMTEMYPMKPFKREIRLTKERVNELEKQHKPFIGCFSFLNIRLKDPNYPCPYISASKCRRMEDMDTSLVVKWNGRVLKADYLETTITDIDFSIISNMYTWDDYHVCDLYSSEYGFLPEQFKSVVMKYYQVKTELKGIKEDDPLYVYYMNNKERLNATYGCTVQDPCKNETYLDEEGFHEQKVLDIPKKLKKMKWTAFSVYQWGVWCAAWGRKNLQDGIDAVGPDFVYCDTDSVKCEGDHRKDFERLNKIAIMKAQKAGAFATNKNGEVKYMGVWEEEDGYEKPNRFCTLGAKKYVVEQPNGDLHLTISGVIKNKKIWDAKENKEKKISSGTELKSLENFREGFTFEEFGKSIVKYNNGVDMYIEREGHQLHITDNVFIRKGTYKLSAPDTVGLSDNDIEMILNGVEVAYAPYGLPDIYMHATDGDE